MVRYVKDTTGRFPERPHYKPEELDQECEAIVVKFLRSKYQTAEFPIATEDLKTLIERNAGDLDCYADLSHYGPNVEGVTEFELNKRPRVKIASPLTEDARQENRLRTTLTHEFGHVQFHGYLFDMHLGQQGLFKSGRANTPVCKRDGNLLDAAASDWMEWQAGYACGAFLMPVTYVKKEVQCVLEDHNHYGPAEPKGQVGRALISKLMQRFQVSNDAARIRLLKLGVLGPERGPSLFT